MAAFVTLFWLAVSPVVFAVKPVLPALIWAVLLPYLLLPEAFAVELPGLPDLDKTSVISIGLVAGFFLFRDKFREAAAQLQTVRVGGAFRSAMIFFLVLLFVGIVFTLLNNREPLQFGPRRISGLRLWDGISFFSGLLFFLTPFFFAVRYLATPQAHRMLLAAIVIAGMYYTIPMLIELRMSPQMHSWVYGYHQHSFAQHVRGGFRPKVFLQHGLWVGFFMLMAFMAALALWRADRNKRWLWAAVWLFAMLVVSKNLGATAIAILLAAVFLGAWSKLQTQIIAGIAICVLLFPALRQAGFIPTQQVVSLAAIVSQDRADSLGFRLRNEDDLLERAMQKPLTGWGIFGREQIYRASDGKVMSITEGRWSQTIGVQGWIGYVGLFGLMTLPLILLGRVRARKEIPPETLVLALIAAGNLIYMIPNSTLTPLNWLVFGAVAGFLQYDAKAADSREAPAAEPAPRTLRYTRFP